MGGYFSIYRPLNVLFIAAAQVLCAFYLDVDASFQTLVEKKLWILIIGTASCVVYGYWINDFLDQKSDLVNQKKNKFIRAIKPIVVYVHLLIFISIALWCGRNLGLWFLSLFMLTLGALTVYSYWLKNVAFLGNVIIAVLHFICLYAVYKRFDSIDFLLILHFSVLSASITLAREMIKDAEDIEGDRLTGAKTLPIVFGMNAANIAIYIVLLFTLSFSLVSFYTQKSYFAIPLLYVYYAYVGLFIVFPLYKIAVDVRYASSKQDYGRLSMWLKYVIFVGILSILFF